ncbi:MgtC/SapB family protein [Lysobacter auxotrophicus]|uniref:DUF4010 domain-containing protein n=1 Tax=Lysobacter auxotrophicus TaxID=2992573 RepID=A0ABN6UIL1_9GAMM|nr:DUF4010 domain-containing protein [Lysobacter auxotrophicus]BDU16132.1 DUF4010 domain-containing protein [Lysobacter auxotrophicus]
MDTDDLRGLLTAIAIGLLIGVVRERGHGEGGAIVAGIRTHAMVATAAGVAAVIGPAALAAVLLAIGALALAAYVRTRDDDPGLTGEMALLVTATLAALALIHTAVAAGLAVVSAVLLFAKHPLRRFAREVVSEREVQDALLLAASALVILPLLPDEPVDPWGVLVPSKLWKLVVLVMAVGMLGHVALRAVGARWGLPVAGFFAGFASSTAAVAGFGQRSREADELTAGAASAALLANLASLLLLVGIVATAAPALLRASAWPLAAAAVVLALGAAIGLRRQGAAPTLPDEPQARAFKLSHGLLLALMIAVVLVASAWLRSVFGDIGALATAVLVALVELHASAASIAQLSAAGGLTMTHAQWGIAALLASSAIAKTVLAFASGNRRYGLLVGGGLMGMAVACAVATGVVVAG